MIKNRHARHAGQKNQKEDNIYKDIQVLIACPTGRQVYADFAMTLAAMTHYTAYTGIKIALYNYVGAEIDHSRNMIVAQAQKLNATHLLFIDSDMSIPKYTVRRMVELMVRSKQGAYKQEGIDKIEILGVTVPKRTFPYEQVAKDLDGNRLNLQPSETRGVVEIGEIGTGLLMVDMELFKEIEQPYFSPYYNKGEDGKIDLNKRVSEDLSFIRKMKEKGHKIYCDIQLSLDTIHIGDVKFDYTSKDFFADAVKLRDEKCRKLLKEHVEKNNDKQ